MTFLKPYKHLPGYIHRFSICVIGSLHIRIHLILTPDGTPYIHRHPFSYISIILQGGYVEQLLTKNHKIIEKSHTAGSVIIRHKSIYHRIKELKHGPTKTLFIAWSHGDWDLRSHKDIIPPDSFRQPKVYGVYLRRIGEKEEYSLFNGVWREGRQTKEEAIQQVKPSTHQAVEQFYSLE